MAEPGEDGGDRHIPVMLDRIRDLFAPIDSDGAVLVDATLGLGGHTEALLTDHPKLTIIGIDRDPAALRHSERRLAAFGDRFRPARAAYHELPDVLADAGVERVDGVLFDLGVSSMQLDQPERGFSYARDAPLDMRMDPDGPLTAEMVVNEYPVKRLARILSEYGEERFASRVAAAIVAERERARLTSSARLAELVRSAIPAATRRTGGHPAKRAFQALRIEVNDELGGWREALPAALAALKVGGRLVALSYHSLEDRILKRALAAGAADSTPVDLPVRLPEASPTLRLLTRGGEKPSAEEITANPRAASARLRAAERIRDDQAGGATVATIPGGAG